MKKLKLKQMEKRKGGSKLTQACYYAPGVALLSEMFGNMITRSATRSFIETCWNN